MTITNKKDNLNNLTCETAMGTYGCTYTIMLPYRVKLPYEDESALSTKYIAIDKCLICEILDLWSKGIKTTGNCCGHNGKSTPFISCKEGYEDQMLALGYKHIGNPFNLHDKVHFAPKSIYINNINIYKDFYIDDDSEILLKNK